MSEQFENIILIGRPASGKSEIIDYLIHTALDDRIRRIHIAKVAVPYSVFENENDLTTRGGEPLAGRLERSLNRLWLLRGRTEA